MSPMSKNLKTTIAILLVIIVAIAAVAAIYLSGILNPTPQITAKDTLTYAISVKPAILDSRRTLSVNELSATLLMQEALLYQNWTQDEHGKFVLAVVPQLVTEWRLYNATTWEFKLRQGVKFHSGNELTANDVKYTFDSLYDPNFPQTQQWSVQPYKHMQVTDNYTVLVSSDKPYGPGAARRFAIQNVPGIVNAQNGAAWGAQYGAAGSNPKEDGTGPYKLVEWASQTDRMVFERFDDYWGTKPQIKTIIIIPITDPVTRVLALQTGTVDVIGQVSPAAGSQLEILNYTVHYVAQTRPHWLGINCLKPYFSDVRVRQALNYAIDRDELIAKLWNGKAVKGNLYLPYIFGYVDTNTYEYNVTKAKELLAAAGYANGLTFEVWAYKGRLTLHEEEVQALAGYWSKIGVTANVKLLEWADYLSKMKAEGFKPYPETPGYDMFSISWNDMLGDPDYNLHIFSVNDTDYPIGAHYLNDVFRINDTVLGNWIYQQRHTSDDNARRSQLQQIIPRIVDDAPLIFLYFETMTWVYNPKLKGITETPVEIIFLKTAYWT